MTGLPRRTDRMPRETETLTPARVVAVALNAVPYEFWKHLPLSETSEPVRSVLKGLELEGYQLVRR